MKNLPLYIICCLLLVSCSTGNQLTKEKASEVTGIYIASNFEISSTWANPIGNSAMNALGVQGALGAETAGSRINIAGNTNYIRKKGDSLEIYLPYYGTRTTGATPLMDTPNSTIQFKGIPNIYTVTNYSKKDRTQITFDIADTNGRHSFLVKIFKDNQVTIDVNATHRSRIQYEGTLVAMPE